jgi:hypothetical protein
MLAITPPPKTQPSSAQISIYRSAQVALTIKGLPTNVSRKNGKNLGTNVWNLNEDLKFCEGLRGAIK